MTKSLGLAALLIALSATAVLPGIAVAQVNVNITIGEAPPPLRFESVPAPRNGYLWAPGYWNWNGNQHVWSSGHWERVRQDYDYVRPEWRQENGQWRLQQGGWKRGRHHGNEGRHNDDHEGDGDHRHHDEGRDGGDRQGRGNEDHCPPGQAKKGNC
jgi:hypothetical protein